MTLFPACALTVLIEVPFFALFGFRSRYALTVTVCANVITNLTLNLSLRFLLPPSLWSMIGGEVAVVLAEYALYRIAFGQKRGLFPLTLAANVLSCGLGLLLF